MKFPTPKELKSELRLSPSDLAFITESREVAKLIVTGIDQRLVLIVGPCSIHDEASALIYADYLSELAKQVQGSCFLVMRAYVEKSRSAMGWKGLLYDPYLDGSHAILSGLKTARRLFLELTKRRVPIAMEFVDPLAAAYLEDLVTWGFIGARTVYSQPHRQLASSFSFPVGFKNGLDGDVDQAIYSLLSSLSPHTSLYIDEEGRVTMRASQGNPWVHLALRGSLTSTNYDAPSLDLACAKLCARGLSPRLLIDCAHGNCLKEHEKQKDVFSTVLQQIQEGNENIMGLMLESYLHAGNQVLSATEPMKEGVSITDPCLDWLSTRELILSADALLSSMAISS